jgi:alkylated DNA repair protein (DNA oxidative demethylase)
MNGLRVYPALIGLDDQRKLVEDLHDIVRQSPLFVPSMPTSGKPFSVRMTNCGSLGWVSDKAGYRYQRTHPVTGQPWPPMPALVLDVWQKVSAYKYPPEACLVNFYEETARMGMHQDKDEEDFDAPVVSISLGDTCVFRVGGVERSDPTSSIKLSSGDVVVLGEQSRMAFHGVDRILPKTSSLLRRGGRINLTLRRVTRPPRDAL